MKRAAFEHNKKTIKSKYKCVYGYQLKDGAIVYQAYISKYGWSKYFENERTAAIAVDKYKLENGEPPVNILVPKIN